MNITYLLGAGASFGSIPIQLELGKKMIEMAMIYFKNEISSPFRFEKLELEKSLVGNEQAQKQGAQLAWYIGYFGEKAIEFRTIDAYARMLTLNRSYPELMKLKLSVSSFFTVWHLCAEFDGIKNKSDEDNKTEFYSDIDKRYIELLAYTLQEKDHNIEIPKRVNFISYNYDLQIERAFRKFCQGDLDWNETHSRIPFNPHLGNPAELQIVHLNGFHGFRTMSGERDQVSELDRPYFGNSDDKSSLFKQIDNLGYLVESVNNNRVSYDQTIRYPWENQQAVPGDYVDEVLKRAMTIMRETNVLVIVGYSFPPFNKSIDRKLMSALAGERNLRKRIIVQNPKASSVQIEQLIEKPRQHNSDTRNWYDIVIEKEMMESFYMPIEL